MLTSTFLEALKGLEQQANAVIERSSQLPSPCIGRTICPLDVVVENQNMAPNDFPH